MTDRFRHAARSKGGFHPPQRHPGKPPQPAKPPRPVKVKRRLPVGSRFFDLLYADNEKWVGKLEVPGCPTVFTATAKALFTCCAKLDDLYWGWVKSQND